MNEIMPFKQIWKSLGKSEKSDLADSMSTSVGYLSQLANGHRQPSKWFRDALEKRIGRTLIFPVSKKISA